MMASSTALLRSLEKIVTPSYLATDPANKRLYSRDMMARGLLLWRAGKGENQPDSVVWPASATEVSEIVKLAGASGTPIVPFGGGSGVSGGAVPVKGGIVVDLKRLNHLLAVDTENNLCLAESGILGEHLERGLNERGYSLGHFPASIGISTLGGFIACRSAGQFSSKYGKIEDMVCGLEVVLADGQIITTGGEGRAPGRAERVSTAGRNPRQDPSRLLDLPPSSDLTPLFLGAEGTLGIVTKALLKIHPLPEIALYRGFRFKNVASALEGMRGLMQMGLRPSVLRLYDPLDSLLLKWGYDSEGKNRGVLKETLSRIISTLEGGLKKKGISQILKHPALFQKFLSLIPEQVLLITGFEGERGIAEKEEKKALPLLKRSGGVDLGRRPGEHWRKHRYSVSFKQIGIFQDGAFADTIEVAATWDRLLPLYESVREALGEKVLVLAHFSHAYHDGASIYFTIVGAAGREEEVALYDEVWDRAMKTTLAQGGTISHHHGIGLLKAKYMEEELGSLMNLFRKIKKKLDPQGILNPGKLGLG
ncbi:MAG: FAD-binding oxidoreductase [Deltaproteobacteria bacterium]|nr:FAD-binding oxidoreductase [Deltaproteobacteria bacterium]